MLKRAVIMRSGAMQYLESDIVPNGASNKIVTVIRDEDTLKKYHHTFKGVALKKEHEDNSPIVGRVLDTYVEDGKIKALIEANLILISDVELSCGYSSELEQISDTEYRLLSFNGDHVAIVDNGRCGEICKIF